MYTAAMNKKIDIKFIPEPRSYSDNLSCMIRCRTVSSKEHFNKAEFEKFDRLLRGRYPHIFEKAEAYDIGNGTFLKITGKESASPLVLMSHTDVVFADAKKWKHPPFAADLENGRIWGRGTVDTKASLCAIFEAVESLLAEGFEPNTDLYILSSANEEIAGTDAQNAVELLKKNGIVPGLVVDEGGAVLKNPIPFSKVKRFAMIGVTERSSARILVKTKDAAQAKAVKRSAKKLRLGQSELIPATRELLGGLSEVLPFPLSSALGYLASHEGAAVRLLTHAGIDARGFCGAVCSAPMLSETEKKNICENENSVVINISGNYYNKIDRLIEEYKAYAGSRGLKTTLLRSREAPAPIEFSDKGCRFVGDTVRSCFDKITVLPYPVLGATDARHFIGYAQSVVRFIPVEISISQLMSFHNKNENVFTASLPAAVGCFRELILRFNAV